MHIIPRETKQGRASEKGFSLIVVLFFVGLVAALVFMSMQGQRGAVQRDQARSAGWHLAQVAKAARVYVRDRSLSENDIYHKSLLAGGGIGIRISQLRSAGLLPENFPETNILDQRVLIFAANYPVDGDPADPSTVASAYVFLQPSRVTQSNPSLTQYIVEGARQNGLYINAPIFSADGFNISDPCRGSAGYADWDTGCLNLADVRTIIGEGFDAGALIAPAWRSDVPDTRAVMRFPQPENAGYATMMTALEMARVERNDDRTCVEFVHIYDYSNGNTPINTGVCRSWSDTVAAAAPGSSYDPARDRRMDIINVSEMSVDTVIAAPQNINATYGTRSTSFRYDPSNNQVTNEKRRSVTQFDYNEVFQISGNVETGGNVVATARMDNPSAAAGGAQAYPTVGFSDAAGMEWQSVAVDHNVNVDHNMTVTGVANINRATVGTLRNDLPGANSAVIRGQADAAVVDSATMAISASGAGLATAVMDANSANVTTETADFFSGASANNGVNVTQDLRGDGAPATIVYRLQGAGSVEANAMTMQGGMTVGGALNARSTTSMEVCAGGSDCPDITPPPGSPLD